MANGGGARTARQNPLRRLRSASQHARFEDSVGVKTTEVELGFGPVRSRRTTSSPQAPRLPLIRWPYPPRRIVRVLCGRGGLAPSPLTSRLEFVR